ncbi:MAG: hypothetical protein Q4C80_04055 [Bacillota bacterium]|nr:hypothetical protein [Bacillota bacterium]
MKNIGKLIREQESKERKEYEAAKHISMLLEGNRTPDIAYITNKMREEYSRYGKS